MLSRGRGLALQRHGEEQRTGRSRKAGRQPASQLFQENLDASPG